ncbi:uncharacterized protein LOC119769517 [Culex quinquefasciatus]|uniref:uncharacterized protein LOC119769517 n=1 Tax=Culex quinquefasciatus TaxID=7176 RepID=UPI0018E35F54|nr:uncharacterized protein LOC119769517 [Culex quinquefasciatus]
MPPKEATKVLAERLAKRKGILALRDNIEKFVSKFNGELDMCQVSNNIEKLDEPNNLDANIAQRVDFEQRYCDIKGFLLSKRPVDLNQTLEMSTMSHSHSHNFHLRLPKIELPQFDGDYSRWLSFRDTFVSMIHANSDIPTVAKLQYLLQSLGPTAKKPYESVDIKADNYFTTWSAILKRYDDKRHLKRQLFRGLYDLPAVPEECASAIHNLADDFQRHVKALEKLDELVQHWDTPLVNMLSYKLDQATLRAWEEKNSEKADVKYDDMIEFLYQRVRVLEASGSESKQSASAKVTGSSSKQSRPRFVANAASSSSSNGSCLLGCSENHHLRRCPVFLGKDVQQRRDLVAQKRLCWNCLSAGHPARKCGSKFSCQTCKQKHHSLVHVSSPTRVSSTPAVTSVTIDQPSNTASANAAPVGSSSTTPQVSMAVQTAYNTVLLETVVVNVVDDHGKKHKARALLDSASMSNFMSGQLAKNLYNRPIKVDVAVAGIGVSTQRVRSAITAAIESRNTTFSTKLEFLILRQPSAELPTVPIDVSTWKLPDIVLADQRFNVPEPIDLVIGSESFWELHTGRKISLGAGLPWLSAVNDRLEAAIQRFWEVETIPEGPAHSVDENRCEEFFAKTTTRNATGRYVVRLPLTDNPEIVLGDSKTIAERRFLGLERRLDRDPATKEAYHKFMHEYLSLGHMELVDGPVDYRRPHCYLPHHPVFKQSSTTTKVRVVFDASCKTSSGYSVNEKMLVGLVVQPDLLSTLLKFRFQAVALVADVEKMYRQVLVHPDDRPLQRIVWRFNPTDPISTYELRTVTYGTASAPFLATRTLAQIAQDNKELHPDAAEAVARDFYVDDLISGAPDVETAIKLRREISTMLAAAGFPLKKWASNAPEVLRDIPPEDLALLPVYDLQDGQTVTTLGIVWDPQTDTLCFRVQLPPPASVLSKRKVMSYIAQIWDPFGLVGPTTLKAKLFMQRLWALKHKGEACAWDTPLPLKIQLEWKEFHMLLHMLSQVKVPRFVSTPGATIQLHFFSDASEKAYGACCYVRAAAANGVTTRLLSSKSKVASLSSHDSINKLELNGGRLSTQLYKKVKKALNLSDAVPVFFWTDSLTVLHWLNSLPSRWKTYVANRVSQIQLCTSRHVWGHVPGVDNPADYISRGLSPLELLDCLCWWFGPLWLKQNPDYWPKTVLTAADASAVTKEERKVPIVAMTTVEADFSNRVFSLTSSFPKLRRDIAFCQRFLSKLRERSVQRRDAPEQYALLTVGKVTTPLSVTPLSTHELQHAEFSLVRLAQQEHYAEEISDLSGGERVAIFVCFSTKAVHIELVSDLSTPAFIAALRRLVARRGQVVELNSDNATAFKGAANALHRVYQMLKVEQVDRNEIFTWCAENGIRWKFIPPRAPHFGGLWEAAVKSAKTHLLKTMGTTSANYEDMLTLLAQIEMCLNSRPLTPMPDDPADAEVLTPGHFLVGSNLQAVPEMDLKEIPDNRLNNWELTQKRVQQIWARWYPEYLQQLQSRATKGCNPPVAVEVGRVVIIKEDNVPPASWPLGKIVKLHPGKDGIVRVVTLKTAAAKEVVRAVARIALLPTPSQ